MSEGLAQGPYTATVSDEGRTRTLRITDRSLQPIGHRASGQLSVSNLSKVAAHWFEVDSNLQGSGYKAENISLYHCVDFPVKKLTFHWYLVLIKVSHRQPVQQQRRRRQVPLLVLGLLLNRRCQLISPQHSRRQHRAQPLRSQPSFSDFCSAPCCRRPPLLLEPSLARSAVPQSSHSGAAAACPAVAPRRCLPRSSPGFDRCCESFRGGSPSIGRSTCRNSPPPAALRCRAGASATSRNRCTGRC